MKFLMSVAWRNLWRHKRRSLITATAMAVAVALCMATIAITDGMFEKIFHVMVEQQLGHVQVHHPEYPATRNLYHTLSDAPAQVEAIEAVDGTVAVSPSLEGFALVGGAERSAGAMLRGIDPPRMEQVTTIHERVTEGTWLPDDPEQDIVLGVGLAEEIEAGLGDQVVAVTQAADGSLGNELYEVVGIASTGNTQMDNSGAWMHLADLQDLLVLPDQAHGITVLADDPDALEDYSARLGAAIGADGDIEVQTWWEASPQTEEMLAMRDFSVVLVLGIVFTVAAFGILNTMLMSVFERTRELGVLKAIGLRPGRLVVLIVFESFFLAGLASAIGLVLGAALDAYLIVYGIDFSAGGEGFTFAGVTLDPVMRGAVRVESVVFIIASTFVVSVGASLWPAGRAARLAPVEAIRSE
jgi:ABC-type lipoprotein release transport system permease subunit